MGRMVIEKGRKVVEMGRKVIEKGYYWSLEKDKKPQKTLLMNILCVLLSNEYRGTGHTPKEFQKMR